jgi:hypothetical protein
MSDPPLPPYIPPLDLISEDSIQIPDPDPSSPSSATVASQPSPDESAGADPAGADDGPPSSPRAEDPTDISDRDGEPVRTEVTRTPDLSAEPEKAEDVKPTRQTRRRAPRVREPPAQRSTTRRARPKEVVQPPVATHDELMPECELPPEDGGFDPFLWAIGSSRRFW